MRTAGSPDMNVIAKTMKETTKITGTEASARRMMNCSLASRSKDLDWLPWAAPRQPV